VGPAAGCSGLLDVNALESNQDDGGQSTERTQTITEP
jgi:hypothetical protein